MTYGRFSLSKKGAKAKSRVQKDSVERNDRPQVSVDVPRLTKQGYSVPKSTKASKTAPNLTSKRKKSGINQPEETAVMATKRMKQEKSTGKPQPNQHGTSAITAQSDKAAQAMNSDQTNDSTQQWAKQARKGTNARIDPKNGSKQMTDGAIQADEHETRHAQNNPSAHNLLADSSQTEQPACTQPSSEQAALPLQTARGKEGKAGNSSDDDDEGVTVPVPLHPHNGQLAEQMLQGESASSVLQELCVYHTCPQTVTLLFRSFWCTDAYIIQEIIKGNAQATLHDISNIDSCSYTADEGGEELLLGVRGPTTAGLRAAARMSNPAKIAADLDAASASEFFMPALADCAPGELHLLHYEHLAEAEPSPMSDCWSSDSDNTGARLR